MEAQLTRQSSTGTYSIYAEVKRFSNTVPCTTTQHLNPRVGPRPIDLVHGDIGHRIRDVHCDLTCPPVGEWTSVAQGRVPD